LGRSAGHQHFLRWVQGWLGIGVGEIPFTCKSDICPHYT
jgi:hypothetical protein